MKKVCFFALVIASSAWGADWKLLKEGDDSDFFYRKGSIKLVDAKRYGLHPSYNQLPQMEVMENYYVRQRDGGDSDYYRSVVRINYYDCDSPAADIFYRSSLGYIQFRESMGRAEKIRISVYNENKEISDNWYHTVAYAMPLDVYKRAWKIVCNKR